MNRRWGRVHVIDDEEDVRKSVEWTLRSTGYDVTCHASAQDYLAAPECDEPACLVVDLLLPGMTGLKLCRKLVASDALCGFVMISGNGDVADAVEAMKLGAIDFLEKPCSRQRLISSVQEALDFSARRHREMAEERQIVEALKLLTAREREVFDFVADGFITKEIAAKLKISRKTVDVHRSKIMQKLQIESPLQLARIVLIERRGMMRKLSPPAEGNASG